MLTKLTIRNFKRFEEVEIELGNPVVFVGPNNSGKTSALQALALWHAGLRRWNEKRAGASAPESLVQRVVRRLNSMGFQTVVEVEAVDENVHFPLPPELQGVQPLTQISASP